MSDFLYHQRRNRPDLSAWFHFGNVVEWMSLGVEDVLQREVAVVGVGM